MNIVIGKIGRSCFFNKKRWSIYAGDDTPLLLYKTLCELYPQHNFYIIGPTDFQKSVKEGCVFPKNLIDLFGTMKAEMGANFRDVVNKQLVWKYLVKYIRDKGINIDLGILLQGPDSSVSLTGVGLVQKRNLEAEAKVLAMGSNYIAPYIGVVNSFQFPWIDVNEDIRYVPFKCRDILPGHDELCVLSQSNAKTPIDRICGYFEKSKKFRTHTIDYKYAGIERLFLIDHKKYDFSDPDHIDVDGIIYQKSNPFIITVNDGGDRLKLMEKWILGPKPDMKIYGRWSDESKEKYPDTFIEKKIIDMEPIMWQTKFTFVPSWVKRHTNFVTQKIWKMMYYGIIPFFDKNGYDTDHYLDIPDFCRVETPKELWQKIDALDENPEAYKKLLKKIYSLLDDKYFDSRFIKETFGPYIEKYDSQVSV